MESSTKGPPAVFGAAEADVEEPFSGVHRRTHQTERSTVSAYAFEAGSEFPIHTHPEEQITVVLEGRVDFTVAGEHHSLGPGETYVVPSDVDHGLRAGPDGARFLAVVVPRRSRADAYEVRDGGADA